MRDLGDVGDVGDVANVGNVFFHKVNDFLMVRTYYRYAIATKKVCLRVYV